MKTPFKNFLAGILAVAGLVSVSLAGGNAFAAEKDVSKALQERIAKLTPEQQAALLALLDQMPAGKDTKTTAAAVTPEEAMRQRVLELETAKKEKKFNMDLAMSHVSKDFNHDGIGKDGARSFLEGVLGAVSVDGVPDIKISLEKTTYKVTGDKVEIYPVEVSAPIGSATLTIYAKLEDGEWRMIGVDGL